LGQKSRRQACGHARTQPNSTFASWLCFLRATCQPGCKNCIRCLPPQLLVVMNRADCRTIGKGDAEIAAGQMFEQPLDETTCARTLAELKLNRGGITARLQHGCIDS